MEFYKIFSIPKKLSWLLSWFKEISLEFQAYYLFSFFSWRKK